MDLRDHAYLRSSRSKGRVDSINPDSSPRKKLSLDRRRGFVNGKNAARLQRARQLGRQIHAPQRLDSAGSQVEVFGSELAETARRAAAQSRPAVAQGKSGRLARQGSRLFSRR